MCFRKNNKKKILFSFLLIASSMTSIAFATSNSELTIRGKATTSDFSWSKVKFDGDILVEGGVLTDEGSWLSDSHWNWSKSTLDTKKNEPNLFGVDEDNVSITPIATDHAITGMSPKIVKSNSTVIYTVAITNDNSSDAIVKLSNDISKVFKINGNTEFEEVKVITNKPENDSICATIKIESLCTFYITKNDSSDFEVFCLKPQLPEKDCLTVEKKGSADLSIKFTRGESASTDGLESIELSDLAFSISKQVQN